MSNSTQKSAIDSIWVAAIKTLKLQIESPRGMRGETMKDKSKKSTYSTTFGVDPNTAVKTKQAAYGHKKSGPERI